MTIGLNICSLIGVALSGHIIIKYNIQRSYQTILKVVGISLMITLVLPPKMQECNKIVENVIMSWLGLVQIYVEIIITQCIILTQQYLDTRFISFVYNFGGFMGRLGMLQVPEVTYRLKNVEGVDIYFLYGVIAILVVILNYMLIEQIDDNQ